MRCARRRWIRSLPWIFVLCAVVGIAAGLFIARFEAPVYQAEYTLCALPESGAQEWESMQMLVRDCRALTQTQVFRQAVLSRVESDGTCRMDVRAERGTHLLRVVVTGADAAIVQNLANEAGAELVERIPRMFDMKSAQEVQRAELPEAPAAAQMEKRVTLAVLAAFVVFSLIFCLIGSNRQPIRFDSPDAEGFCLGAVADVRREAKYFVRKNGKRAEKRMLLWQVDRLIREDVRRLMLRLRCRCHQAGGQCVVVTAVRDEGESAAATVLWASEAAQQGFRVLLMEMDADEPQLAKLLGVRARADVHDYLQERAEWQETLVHTPIPTLAFIDWLHPDVNVADLAASPAFASFLQSARSHFDWIILHAAPQAQCADAAMLSLCADALVLMAQDGRYDLDELEDAARMQAKHGRLARGVVFTGVSRRRLENAD